MTENVSVKTKKRSALKTFGVKLWIFLIVLIGLSGLAFIGFTSLLVKPDGFNINGANNDLGGILNNPELAYWNNGKFTTIGIIASVVVGVEFVLLTMTPILYNKLHFVIGKKGSFVSIVVFILVFTLLMFLAGILSKNGLFSLPTGTNGWTWHNILWQVKDGNIFQPTVVWWGIFIVSCVGVLVILILFIVFLIKFLFARSHDKE